MIDNKKAYSKEEIVNYYLRYDSLQKPEQTILDILKPYLKGMKMLDIGVGGGRTTLRFAPLVKEYIGIDYSEGMIEGCRKKFSGAFENAKFITADVRYMDDFKSNDFDFILFSFNGIDLISNEEREKAFHQIKRILKKGGYFCFSSHNIQSLEDFFKIHLRLNVFAIIKKILVNRKVKNLNQLQLSKAKTNDFIIINDGAHNFMTDTYYIRPAAQLHTLRSLGFKNIRFFSYNSGKEIMDEGELNNSKDKWIYYLCSE